MRLAALLLSFLGFAVFSSAEIEKRADVTPSPTSTFNYGPISAIVGSIASAINAATPVSGISSVAPKTVNLSNIAEPPSSFIPIIMTVVPLSVLGDLLDSNSRSSLASEFQNGTTPAWYQSLPASIQSYLTLVNSQIQAGALSANTSAIPTSSSTAMAVQRAPAPTGAIAVNMLGALGIAGLALAL